MKLRTAALAALVIASCVACQTPPRSTGPPSYDRVTPPYCPFDDKIVQFNGDSIGVHYSSRVQLPEHTVFNAAQPASAWVWDDVVVTLSTRIQQWIDQCGAPAAVVLQGGINDLTHGVPFEEMTAEVQRMSDWLEERGVPTVWVALHPMPSASRQWHVQDSRIAYNEWLTSADLWGHAVDCTPSLEHPGQPGSLHRSFWTYADLTNVDGVHMNRAGYETMARCVEPVIQQAIESATPELARP